MPLYLDVTWPVCKTVGPLADSDGLARELQDQMANLRHDLVRQCGDRLYIHGLFGCRNKVRDVDRYGIIAIEQAGGDCAPSQPGCAITITDHQVANAVPTQATGSDHHPLFVSTHPYVDRRVEVCCDQPSLVIVLESPHRDEYGGSVEAPIAPARGATGARIHKHLCNVLNSCAQMKRILLDHAPLRVIISNPIPFQTSAYAIDGGRLGVSGRLRDLIWRDLWCMGDNNGSKYFQEEFVAKLARYHPIAIVNVCTSGGNPNRRREVRKVIQARARRCGEPFHGVRLYETDHPSKWGADTRLTYVQ